MSAVAAHQPLATVVVGAAEASASGTMAILDLLMSTGRSWQKLHGESAAPASFAPRLLSLDGQPHRQPNGIVVEPQGRLDDVPHPDIVIVPPMILDLANPLLAHHRDIARWISQAYDHGATVTSVCSGALLLAEAGILDGHEATTHWGYYDTLARHYPDVTIRRERILVPTGPGHRIITAAGGASWYDLLLYLIARFAGEETARQIAKVYLVQAHDKGQLPYAGLSARRQHDDQLIADAQLWLADWYAQPNPVAALAMRSGLTERGFHQRFKRATGLAPMEYVQILRIEEAKQLLETTGMALDEIAGEVGYVEPASFRRLFRRLVGVTPSVYRRRNLLPVAARQANSPAH